MGAIKDKDLPGEKRKGGGDYLKKKAQGGEEQFANSPQKDPTRQCESSKWSRKQLELIFSLWKRRRKGGAFHGPWGRKKGGGGNQRKELKVCP